MKIRSIDEATSILQNYVPEVASYTGDGMSLDRMWPLLELVGNPQNKLKAIHIAGTSGKTSTSYYIAHILQKSGKRTGLTVSPHIDSITERLQIDGAPVSEEFFCQELGEFLSLIENSSIKPSYFELLVVFVLWVFVRAHVEYAVIETGMGGLLDGTNVLQRVDKVCVITDIGLDHTAILGDTLSKIAFQKAGIIHEQNVVIMYNQADEIMDQVRSRSREKKAQLRVVDNKPDAVDYSLSNVPDFQKRNWILAHEVCKIVAQRDEFTLTKLNPEQVVVPGRMDIQKYNDSIIVMDGAHNEQKMQTFVQSFMKQFHGERADILLALKTGKEYMSVIDALMPIQKSVVLTTFRLQQDMPITTQDPKVLADYCQQKNIDAVVVEDLETALNMLLGKNSKVKLITGSLYLVGQVRRLMHDKSVLL